ncbi:hypothetical protein RHGRI_023335 [Rhododendron griersonianum]|uniref:Uncharacterized protein n=1 Tax=Rhododendron griersonianum TaxID=479676 RepID=A0AAV6J6H8_9ERIC|nr:hypothetical protein RHGRI_023335 [Rhododendron griersonianum]
MCGKVANILLGEGAGGSIEVETQELEKVDPQFARVKGLKKKKGLQIKGRRRLKPWFEKGRKRKKKVVSQSTHLDEHIDHNATTTIVHDSFMTQRMDVEIPYVPQMMSSEVNCHSIPSSSQASYNPQTSQVTPIDLASHSSKGYSLLDDDSFLELLSFSEDPKHNESPSHKHRRYSEVNPAIMAGPRHEKQNTGKPSQSRRIPENPRGHGEEDAHRGPNVQQSKPAKMTASPLANGYDLWSI